MKTSTFITIIILIAAAIGGITFAMHQSYPAYSLNAMLAGNGVMAALTLISFLLVTRQISGRPHAFVRGVSSASLLKLFVCAGGILAYALATRPHVHKPTLFVLLGIYVVYTVVETVLLSRLARKKQ